ncbi:GNAT family N-acetyltransferase [Flavobacterium sp.]|uniref:GNAT family N-acetyltransferase n=1 Tax=Flavobacterium sp. TaxID=239 RepID=UPI0039E68AD6
MKTVFQNWKIDRLQDISAEDFFVLIERNAHHIRKTFPVTLNNCLDLDKTIQFLGENIDKEENGTGYYFYLRSTQTQQLIGYVCIKNIDPKIKKCELAYFIDKDFEGQGIISQAVSQTIDFCFSELGMNKVFICTSKINMASQRIATKHGFSHEGILREEFKSGEGQLEDVMYFGLLKSEWNER